MFRAKPNIHIPWKVTPTSWDVVIKTETVIDAFPEDVWKIVKKVEDYGRFSRGAYKATLIKKNAPESKTDVKPSVDEKKPEIGDLLVLKLKGIKEVTEIITNVDDLNYIISWSLEGPLGKTERFHCLKPFIENGKIKTYSVIVDKLPGPIGMLTQCFVGVKKIEERFKTLHEGIKTEALNIQEEKFKELTFLNLTS